MAGWTLDDIPWQTFDPGKVEPDLLKLVKAASLVEGNAADYRSYLNRIFADDARFRRAVDNWAREEQQHGAALGRWATLADPSFDFDAALRRFAEGFRIDIDAEESIRGSRTGELVARCMVETGTNSFYTALAEAADEPVLKDICRRIADDEQAHYWLFHRTMRRYLERENLGFWRRLRVALGRIAESEDDELAYAYYAANGGATPYDRRSSSIAYERRALACFTPSVTRNAVSMIFNAVGLEPHGVAGRVMTALAWRFIRLRRFWIARAIRV
jgi:rubrerythrin